MPEMGQLKVEKTGLHGVLAITPPTNFEDFRGSLAHDVLYVL